MSAISMNILPSEGNVFFLFMLLRCFPLCLVFSMHFETQLSKIYILRSCGLLCPNFGLGPVASRLTSAGLIGLEIGLQVFMSMATHSSTLARKIPWTEEPGGLQSMGSLRVWHDWVTSLSLFTFMHWRRKWQPTPVFLPGESQGRRSLVGCHLWGRTESDATEVT